MKQASTNLSPELLAAFIAGANPALSKVRQLYLLFYAAITDGRLPEGSRLPGSRALAQQLGLGRNTVVAVYRQLGDEALVEPDGRRGTRVCHVRQADTLAIDRTVALQWPLSQRSRHLRPATSQFPVLAPGEPDASLFPTDAWRRASVVAARLPAMALGYRRSPLERLQAAIARYLATYRSLSVAPEQILITSSTRQSLMLAATLYADAGDSAWVETPGYPGAAEAFGQQGLDLHACAVDADGLQIPRSDSSTRPPARRSMPIAPRLIYVTPCFQYPTGVALSARRRAALMTLSAQHGSVIFEDDYDSEFRDDTQPRPALSAGQEGASVLHAGTFSKIIFPAARVAWLVMPVAQMPVAQRCLRAIGGGTNTVAQSVVAELLDNGTVARHLQRARQVYAQRREALIQALHAEGMLTPANLSAGSLSLIVTLPQAVLLLALESALAEQHLGAVPLERFRWDEPTPERCAALVLGLGNVETLAIDAAVAALHVAIRQTLRS